MPLKDLWKNAYSSFIHNFSNLELSQMSTYNKWMNKLWHIYIKEYYTTIKRDTESCNSLGETWTLC